MVEQGAVNAKVPGSSPGRGADSISWDLLVVMSAEITTKRGA